MYVCMYWLILLQINEQKHFLALSCPVVWFVMSILFTFLALLKKLCGLSTNIISIVKYSTMWFLSIYSMKTHFRLFLIICMHVSLCGYVYMSASAHVTPVKNENFLHFRSQNTAITLSFIPFTSSISNSSLCQKTAHIFLALHSYKTRSKHWQRKVDTKSQP